MIVVVVVIVVTCVYRVMRCNHLQDIRNITLCGVPAPVVYSQLVCLNAAKFPREKKGKIREKKKGGKRKKETVIIPYCVELSLLC